MAQGSAAKLGRRTDVDMTQGSIFRHMMEFALPLLAGNIFQQLYNMVDTWVVGDYVSSEAFSAVGTVAPVVNTLIGLFRRPCQRRGRGHLPVLRREGRGQGARRRRTPPH